MSPDREWMKNAANEWDGAEVLAFSNGERFRITIEELEPQTFQAKDDGN